MNQLSAQTVGREFVRQYYTMLHEAPHFLHRFYSHNSSFVHGGMERPGEEQAPAIGQAEINKKIVSLEFRDCHAKICQVDSQASVEGSVVIQVVGELSNCGSPMRRFVQTFVLAPQSPKKYYLHNDIFRYQDEVFTDVGSEVDSSTVDEINDLAEADAHAQQQQHQPLEHERMSANSYQQSAEEPVGVKREKFEEIKPPEAVVINDGGQDGVSHGEPAAPAVSPERAVTSGTMPAVETVKSEQVATEPQATEVKIETDVGGDEEPEPVEDDRTDATSLETAQQEPQPVVPAQKPTWAAMASRNTANTGATSLSSAPGYAMKPQATIRPEPKSEQRASAPNGALPQRLPRTPQQTSAGEITPGSGVSSRANAEGNSRPPPTENGRGGQDGVRGGGSVSGDGEDARRNTQPVYPDAQQVFVGNVPHQISDADLKEYFDQYGTVVDIRINRKMSNNLPNFGFVSFDSVDAVHNILAARPLPKLHGKHRLNVEEKKPKEELAASRPRSSGPRPPVIPNKQPNAFGRENTGNNAYSASGGRGRGGFNNGGGTPQNGAGGNYGGGVGGGNSGRSYTRSCSSDEGQNTHAPAAQTSQR